VLRFSEPTSTNKAMAAKTEKTMAEARALSAKIRAELALEQEEGNSAALSTYRDMALKIEKTLDLIEDAQDQDDHAKVELYRERLQRRTDNQRHLSFALGKHHQ
jgi:hypothetical protein